MLGGADNSNGELPSYIIGANTCAIGKIAVSSEEQTQVFRRPE